MGKFSDLYSHLDNWVKLLKSDANSTQQQWTTKNEEKNWNNYSSPYKNNFWGSKMLVFSFKSFYFFFCGRKSNSWWGRCVNGVLRNLVFWETILCWVFDILKLFHDFQWHHQYFLINRHNFQTTPRNVFNFSTLKSTTFHFGVAQSQGLCLTILKILTRVILGNKKAMLSLPEQVTVLRREINTKQLILVQFFLTIFYKHFAPFSFLSLIFWLSNFERWFHVYTFLIRPATRKEKHFYAILHHINNT